MKNLKERVLAVYPDAIAEYFDHDGWAVSVRTSAREILCLGSAGSQQGAWEDAASRLHVTSNPQTSEIEALKAENARHADERMKARTVAAAIVEAAAYRPAYSEADYDVADWILAGRSNHDSRAMMADLIARAASLKAENAMSTPTEPVVGEARTAADVLRMVKKEWQHNAPSDCYSTGPCTGEPIRDYISCPGCAVQKAVDDALALPAPQEPVADVPSGDTVLPELTEPISKSRHWERGLEWAMAGERATRKEREDQLRHYKARCESAERKIARLEELNRQCEDLRAANQRQADEEISRGYLRIGEAERSLALANQEIERLRAILYLPGRPLVEAAHAVITTDMRDMHGRTQREAQTRPGQVEDIGVWTLPEDKARQAGILPKDGAEFWQKKEPEHRSMGISVPNGKVTVMCACGWSYVSPDPNSTIAQMMDFYAGHRKDVGANG